MYHNTPPVVYVGIYSARDTIDTANLTLSMFSEFQENPSTYKFILTFI